MVGEHVDVCVRERGRQADSEFTGRLQEALHSPPSEFISLWSEVQVKWAPEVWLVTFVKTVLRRTEPWTCWVQDRLQVVSLRIDVDSDFALQQSACVWVLGLVLALTVLLQCVCLWVSVFILLGVSWASCCMEFWFSINLVMFCYFFDFLGGRLISLFFWYSILHMLMRLMVWCIFLRLFIFFIFSLWFLASSSIILYSPN